jgi:hypothetical protein
MRHPVYLIYGIALLAFMGAAQFLGWSLGSLNQERSAPRSIRDNPGAYRSSYGGYSRYTGGK